MNRRGFFKALAATAVIALASKTRLAEISLTLTTPGQRYAQALALSMIETKETLVANIMNLHA